MSVADGWAEYKDEFRDEFNGIFDELVGAGNSPKVVAAAIKYVDTKNTQKQVGEEFGVSQMAIRNTYPSIIAFSEREDVEPSDQSMTAVEIVEEIGDELGWEKDCEYSISKAYADGSPTVNVLKKGLESIHEEIVEGGHDAE